MDDIKLTSNPKSRRGFIGGLFSLFAASVAPASAYGGPHREVLERLHLQGAGYAPDGWISSEKMHGRLVPTNLAQEYSQYRVVLIGTQYNQANKRVREVYGRISRDGKGWEIVGVRYLVWRD